jgi:hypothetical protein
MKRLLASSTLALAAGLVAAACSSKVTVTGSFDPGVCARMSACLGTSAETFGGNCEAFWDALQVAALGGLGTEDRVFVTKMDCITDAADCTAMKACFQATPAQAAVCSGAIQGPACSDDVLVDCGATRGATDCAAAGQHCIAGASPPNCGIEACDASTAPSCDGDLLVACAAGALQSTNCTRFLSASCASSSSGSATCTTQVGDACGVVGGTAQCVGSGAPCDATTFQTVCDGTAVVGCSGGKIARVDCAELGPESTCTSNGNGTFFCGAAGTQCTSSTAESCNGSVLTYCWFGTVATLDCKQYGLSGCATTMQGALTWARCTE